MSQQRVWLITGANSGFGTEFVHQVLARGDKVIATGRNPDKLIASLGNTTAHLLRLDVTSSLEELKAIAEQAEKVYGRIDVLVNNAGYVEMGTIEESTPDRTFEQFNTNVFGMLNVIRAFLPYMRERRSGSIVNIGSVAGWMGIPVSGLYCASKWAVAALSEALKGEVGQFGIEVHCIEPGYFATSLLTPSNLMMNKSRSITDYAQLNQTLEDTFTNTNGQQLGSPKKGVARMIEAVTHTGYAEGKEIPTRVVVGRDAYEMAGNIMAKWEKERQEWKEWSEDAVRDDIEM